MALQVMIYAQLRVAKHFPCMAYTCTLIYTYPVYGIQKSSHVRVCLHVNAQCARRDTRPDHVCSNFKYVEYVECMAQRVALLRSSRKAGIAMNSFIDRFVVSHWLREGRETLTDTNKDFLSQ